MARSWGSYISFLLLDDAGPPPIDVDRQEVLEDREVYDEDESYLAAFWGSSLPASSTSSSYHPLSPSLVARRSGAMRPLLRLLLPGRSHSLFFTTSRRRQSGLRQCAASHVFFRRHGPRHRCPAGRHEERHCPSGRLSWGEGGSGFLGVLLF